MPTESLASACPEHSLFHTSSWVTITLCKQEISVKMAKLSILIYVQSMTGCLKALYIYRSKSSILYV